VPPPGLTQVAVAWTDKTKAKAGPRAQEADAVASAHAAAMASAAMATSSAAVEGFHSTASDRPHRTGGFQIVKKSKFGQHVKIEAPGHQAAPL